MRLLLNWKSGGLILAGLMVFYLVGCNQPTATSTGGTDAHDHSADEDHDHSADDGHDHSAEHGHEEGQVSDDADEITTALAALSPEDRAAAEKQKTCPVSDEPLGSMGTPKKVQVQEREVFICCEGCEEALTKDPDKYLAKLSE